MNHLTISDFNTELNYKKNENTKKIMNIQRGGNITPFYNIAKLLNEVEHDMRIMKGGAESIEDSTDEIASSTNDETTDETTQNVVEEVIEDTLTSFLDLAGGTDSVSDPNDFYVYQMGGKKKTKKNMDMTVIIDDIRKEKRKRYKTNLFVSDF